jgi:hypothetical protein
MQFASNPVTTWLTTQPTRLIHPDASSRSTASTTSSTGDVRVRRQREREPALDCEQEPPVERREVGGGLLGDARGVHLGLRQRLPRKSVVVDDGELEVDVVVGEHREDEYVTAGSLLDLGEDAVPRLSTPRRHDEPHVPLVVAPVVVVHLPVAVYHLGDLVEALVGRLHRGERRGADDRRVEHRAEPPEHAAVAEPLDALQRLRLGDSELLPHDPERALFDREAALVVVDESGVHVVEPRAPVARGSHCSG